MISELQDAAHAFLHHLTSIAWAPLGVAVGLHVLKLAARSRAWRNIVAAAYPETVVRWRSVFGAYLAGVGVNAVLPARSGDLLKLYLVKHRTEGATYPALAGTLAVETLVDLALSSALLGWALAAGVLPGLHVLPHLPSIDWSWAPSHPRLAIAIGVAALVLVVAAAVWVRRRLREFGRGVAILRRPRRYFRRVVTWQLLDWGLRLAIVFFMLRAFGLPAGAYNAFLVQASLSLSTVLPLTPAGIGTQQGLILYVLSGKASRSAVLSFSVGMNLTLMVANLVLGFGAIALMLRTLRWRRVVEPEQKSVEQG